MSIDLSLDRVRKLQALLPPYTRPTCHITGTNGKGSVSALVSSILRASAPSPTFLVGRFNSPHLVTVHDCITLNNSPVSPEMYNAARSRVEETDANHSIGASSFELLTCTALHIFETVRADIVVAEVGMGGRLDATNVIPDETVLVSAMTEVDLDHQSFLGETIGAIAREKAAIARKGRPFVLGQQAHAEVESVVREVVGQAGGDVLLAPTVTLRDWDEVPDGPLPSAPLPPPPQPVEAAIACFPETLHALLPLYGEHQLANLGTALGVISAICTHSHVPWRAHIAPDSVTRGIKETTWPGRLSFHKLPGRQQYVLVDGAHNPASARTLAAYIAQLRPRIVTYILALSHSPPKTPAQTLAPLLALSRDIKIGVALVTFSQPAGMPWVRAEPIEVMRTTVFAQAPDTEVWASNAEAAPFDQFRTAMLWALDRHANTGADGLIVVAGSLYLVAEFYRLMRSDI
ncbi:FolC bifunctional protein [Laetiporus sulphureus 93-53]|uniref:FolC bifunctional protein n=1 Tax=Laetiporus sulphureus 93-53 TaxID=1314785 RepID=A0A165FQ53_9APHY|nr:FolC bifunctional protein [Laetiporus sulphureus 93-53]KZT09308.1 FolC bifunctional protein [Laetiporus sulphureus 93-53]